MHRDNVNNVIPAFEPAPTGIRRGPISAIQAIVGGAPARQLGTILTDSGKLTAEAIERVLQLQREEGLRFGEAALKLGLITESDLHLALAEQFDFPCLLPGDEKIAPAVIAAYQPFDARVEAFRTLRAQVTLRWLDAEHGGRTLAIVSPERGEGRSYLAANLAVVFAQLGARTVLIDADMRYPRQHTLFKLSNRSGLSAILAGRGDSGSIQRVEPFDTLSIITAGAIPPNPQELLARPTFTQLLDELVKEFYVVIVDTPAGVGVADAQFICRGTRAALMVLRKNYTRAKAANRFVDELGPTKATLIGTVLNEF
jgi:chain length determinant protein tyrosine kinase EpsG